MAYSVKRPATAFGLDAGRKGQGGRQRDPKHLEFIRALPCLVSGAARGIEAAHIRYGDPKHGKPGTGMGTKPDDKWAVPLSAAMHREGPNAQHRANERDWWAGHGIDPIEVAKRLFEVSGDIEAGRAIVAMMGKGKPWAR